MKRVYPSKVNVTLLMLTQTVAVLSFLPGLLEGSAVAAFFLLILMSWLCAVFLGFRYEIEGNRLRVVSMFFLHQDYDIRSFRSIRRTRSMLSAPAASLNRLEITMQKGTLVISPRRAEDFVQDLLAVHPELQIVADAH